MILFARKSEMINKKFADAYEGIESKAIDRNFLDRFGS